jgi:rare lipoprotein A
MRHYYLMPLLLLFTLTVQAQRNNGDAETVKAKNEPVKAVKKKPKVLFGIASYYADKFNGRQTANGENYDHTKATAACNVLPLGTWIRVTNLQNGRRVVVRINDRLHPKMKRIVDLSRSSARQLGYTANGLAEVKVEVIGIKKPKEEPVAVYK